MHFDEYRRHDALGLAQLVAAGEVTASELLELALARAEAVNPSINAVIIRMDDIARKRATESLTGAFAGVPFLLKDLGQDYAGTHCAYGCKGLKDKRFKAPHHAEITHRWLKAGVVIFGRTNTPEFGIQWVTEPSAWGATRNPWNLSHTPGGSSGGSAAAIAAGIVPAAGANDAGGSIRVPAAVCGLFGFKPGRARTPWGPERAELMQGVAINHVLTRSVRDSAAMLDATHGKELASGFHIAPPERPYLEEVARDPGKLRISYCAHSPLGTEVSAEAVLAVDNAAKLLESLGHHVEHAEPPIDWEQMFEDFMSLGYANCAAFVAEVTRRFDCRSEDFEPDTLLLARFGRAIRADEYVECLTRWHDYQRQMNEFHLRYDVYMTPTIALPPPLIGQTATPHSEQKFVALFQSLGMSRAMLKSARMRETVREKLKWVPFTELANLTGAPAMSVPLHWTPAGLPLGVHFTAAPSEEGLLFRLAAQLEQARPWFSRVPEL